MPAKLVAILSITLGLIGCKENNSISDPETVSIKVISGTKVAETLASRNITIAISPKLASTPSKSVSNRFKVGGRYLPSSIADANFNYANKGDVFRTIDVCNDISPGENIPIEYEYLAADGSVVEAGQVTLAKVVYACK